MNGFMVAEKDRDRLPVVLVLHQKLAKDCVLVVPILTVGFIVSAHDGFSSACAFAN